MTVVTLCNIADKLVSKKKCCVISTPDFPTSAYVVDRTCLRHEMCFLIVPDNRHPRSLSTLHPPGADLTSSRFTFALEDPRCVHSPQVRQSECRATIGHEHPKGLGDAR